MARRSATDVLYTAMTTEGIRDVRLSDLVNPTTADPTANPVTVNEFIVHLQELYDLLPTHRTADPRAQVNAALASDALRMIVTIIPNLPRHLRPFRSDISSIITIAIRLQLQTLTSHSTGHP